MARILFTMAIAQLLIPVIALIVWAQISWGVAGVMGTFVLNSIFALLFAGSGALLQRAARESK